MVDIETKPLKSRISSPVVGSSGPFSGFAGQAAEVTGDILELVELQVKLAKLDANDAVKRVIWPMGFMVFAVCLAMAALPVVFFGLAGWVGQLAGIADWQSQLLVGLIGIVVAVVVAALAIKTITTSLTTFNRSSQELSKNIAWFKSIFRKS